MIINLSQITHVYYSFTEHGRVKTVKPDIFQRIFLTEASESYVYEDLYHTITGDKSGIISADFPGSLPKQLASELKVESDEIYFDKDRNVYTRPRLELHFGKVNIANLSLESEVYLNQSYENALPALLKLQRVLTDILNSTWAKDNPFVEGEILYDKLYKEYKNRP